MDPENKPAAGEPPPQERRIPNSDMQAEDAGTPESGNQDDDERANAAQSVTKQTSKTDEESGGKSR